MCCQGAVRPSSPALPPGECLDLHRFETLEQARALIAEFIARYNTQWLIERLGHRTPAQARAEAPGRAA